jgi:hypothetical protein
MSSFSQIDTEFSGISNTSSGTTNRAAAGSVTNSSAAGCDAPDHGSGNGSGMCINDATGTVANKAW